MSLFQVIAILVTLTAICAYINHRFLYLHPSIGIMLAALALSLTFIVLGRFGLPVQRVAASFLADVHFDDAVLHWMLGFLLFAGAMSVDLNELAQNRGVTAVLVIVGTVASMFIIAAITFGLFLLLRKPLPFNACLLFGALISPTDPVAVIGLMKGMGASKRVQTVISAESLFNDGIGVVLFLTILESGAGGRAVSFHSVAWLFTRETLGGAVLGFAAGILVYRLLRSVYNFQVEVLLTLALVMGSYALAEQLHMSAPIAAVVAGLIIGNEGHLFPMAAKTREDLERFWELIEEILNAVLFLLIGLQVLVTPFNVSILLATLVEIPIVLLARWLSVMGTIYSYPESNRSRRSLISILTWGGLRGGLPVAMALSLPPGNHRNEIVAVTYGVVLFSILIQGTTIKAVIDRCAAPERAEAQSAIR